MTLIINIIFQSWHLFALSFPRAYTYTQLRPIIQFQFFFSLSLAIHTQFHAISFLMSASFGLRLRKKKVVVACDRIFTCARGWEKNNWKLFAYKEKFSLVSWKLKSGLEWVKESNNTQRMGCKTSEKKSATLNVMLFYKRLMTPTRKILASRLKVSFSLPTLFQPHLVEIAMVRWGDVVCARETFETGIRSIWLWLKWEFSNLWRNQT